MEFAELNSQQCSSEGFARVTILRVHRAPFRVRRSVVQPQTFIRPFLNVFFKCYLLPGHMNSGDSWQTSNLFKLKTVFSLIGIAMEG